MGTKARFSLGVGYCMFDLQANLPSSVFLLLCYRHSSASEIPLPEELNRTGNVDACSDKLRWIQPRRRCTTKIWNRVELVK